jgi:hypothetical protein
LGEQRQGDWESKPDLLRLAGSLRWIAAWIAADPKHNETVRICQRISSRTKGNFEM